ncbi:chemotaxis protein CheA [Sphingopyxis sp. MWB1]|uniref:chemotaxis protein CheA n=1 Tax=Sphingopyxis sp. MWB1 TaxID=1537715 RepID=UPI000519F198|nr:chemotaxis protein CheW [Sphingopyxis sp. MWB1]
MDDLLNDFLAETTEILAEAGGAIVAWEADPADRTQLDAIFRLLHTIKGSSGFLPLPRVTALSHAAEDALDQVRRGARTATPALVSAILGIVDRLNSLCDALGDQGSEPAGDDRAVIAALDTADAADAAAEAPPSLAQPEEPQAMPGDAAPVEVAGIPLRREDDLAGETQSWRSIRVPLQLLDSVMTGVTDIVLARNEFARMLRESGVDPAIIGAFDRLSDSIAAMRQSVSHMRMQRIDKLFAPLPRIVRDLARDLGKKVHFETTGGEVELDREMMENIRDPLIHIIRNAIDHGVEPLEDRVKAGKNITATLSVSARQSGNQIEIAVRDDGRGLSPDKIVAKAVGAQLISAAEARQLSMEDKLDLIFRPGFSTASRVTEVSGRGVGMDIVKANIEKIGGVVELQNDEGCGLALILRVPMTLTIISGLMLRAGGYDFAVPRGAVREILLENSDTVRIDRVGGGEVATIRGERYPLLRLETVLGCGDTPGPDVDADEEEEDRAIVVVRPSQGQSYALSVAAIHDQEELVIKPAAPMIMATGLYAGTTLPDHGRPVLLLDVQGLIGAAGIDASEAGRNALREADAVADSGEDLDRAQLLLFEEEGCALRGVRLSVVERVEDIAADAFFMTGGRVAVRIGEDILPVHAAKKPEGPANVKLLRLYDGRSALCYPIATIRDIVRLPLDMQPAPTPGTIAGVTLVSGEPVELIDPHWLMAQHVQPIREGAAGQPLCQLLDDDDGWGEHFLAPLLRAAGYRVERIRPETGESATAAERAAAAPRPDILLSLTDEGSDAARDAPGPDVPVIRLRSSALPAGPEDQSVYRYDRAALFEALGRHVGRGRGHG